MMANVLLGIHCVVPGCGSTQRRVNQWKAKNCLKPKHKGKSHAQCMCPEPYQFFKFPVEPKLQKLWLERVKRPDLEVNNLTRVCSMHFIEGKPTRRHYFPDLKLHRDQDEDEADNEMEDMEYLDEGEETDEVRIQEAKKSSPPPAKKGRSSGGTVSIVPMELLQEPAGNEEQQGEEEDYEERLTISRYNQGREGGAYEVPTNTVTITRVNTTPHAVTTCSKPANRFINTSKSRGDTGATGNRFLRDRGASSATPSTVGLGRMKMQSVGMATASQSKPASLANAKSVPPLPRLTPRSGGRIIKTTSTPSTIIQQRRKPEKDVRPQYEIDMMDEDEDDGEDDGDSSELSDIGIDIQPTGSLKQQYTSKDMSTAKTLSALGLTRIHPTPSNVVPVQKEAVSVAKPKLIPILAVAPKSQQGTIFQPVQTPTRPGILIPAQQFRKVTPANSNVTATASAKPVATATSGATTSSVPSSSSPAVAKTVIAVAGSSCAIKTESSSGTPVITSTSSLKTVNAGDQKPSTVPTAAPTATLATYDPTKQQLQIANPVKYIQECHTKIAQLLAEKQTLESRNVELEAKVQELQKSNNDLRREIVHQALNAARRTPQQMSMSTPTFNLIPTALMNASPPTTIKTESQNGNGNSSDGNSGSGSSGNKPRIRYMIRRPGNSSTGTNSTK